MQKLLYDRVRLIRGLQAALNNGFSDQERAAIANVIAQVRGDAHHQFLSYSQEEIGMVSYAKCPSHKLETGKRIRTTLGRYIRRHCSVGKDVLRDNLLGELCGYVFRAIEYSDATAPAYTILTGQAITEFYRFGPVSCMSGSSAHYTEFYAINPERVALVTERRLLRVLTDAGEEEMPLLARALLWTSDEGERMLDRIYIGIGASRHNEGSCEEKVGKGPACVCEEIINRFRAWALKNKITNRGSLCGAFEVTMRVAEHVPYLDTLEYGTYIGDDTLRISNKSGDHCLKSVEGNRPGENTTRCCACGSAVRDDDVFWAADDTYCNECFHERYFHCHHCGEVFDSDLSVTVGDYDYCEECVGQMFVCCGDCHEYVAKVDGNAVHVADGTMQVCESCLEKYVCCTGCLEYFDEALVQTDKHGNEYCSTCIAHLQDEPVQEPSVHQLAVSA